MRQKIKYPSKKYKMQYGVQQIASSDLQNPDYQKAYDIRNAQDKNKADAAQVGELGLMFVGAPPGLTRGVLKGTDEVFSSLTKDAYGNYRNKEMEVLDTFANPVNTISKGINIVTGNKEQRNQSAADLWSGSLGALGEKKLLGIKNPLGGDKILGMKNPFKKNPFGQTTTEKVKEAAIAEENKVAQENANKFYVSGASTDAQTALAKRGKYKLRTGTSTFKQPRLIETEGREPIFSPKKADGTRDLLYYNPNDPTHEEGGVKAVVMPKNRYNNGTSKIMSERKHSVNPEIEPPTPYELMPKPPKSRFNKDSKRVKVYR